MYHHKEFQLAYWACDRRSNVKDVVNPDDRLIKSALLEKVLDEDNIKVFQIWLG